MHASKRTNTRRPVRRTARPEAFVRPRLLRFSSPRTENPRRAPQKLGLKLDKALSCVSIEPLSSLRFLLDFLESFIIMAEILRRGSKISTDSETLALLGKKQVLKRRFGFWSLFAFAVCELITWETVLALFAQGKISTQLSALQWLILT
jgi:hypothetical protein